MAVLIHRKADGSELKLQVSAKPLVLGRGLEADIRVEDDEISRSHCAIWTDGDKFLIKDLRSRNGTFVNDRRVEEETELSPGDRIRIGHFQIVFEVEGRPGVHTMIRQVEKEMEKGKGFSTILREVVRDMPKGPPPGNK